VSSRWHVVLKHYIDKIKGCYVTSGRSGSERNKMDQVTKYSRDADTLANSLLLKDAGDLHEQHHFAQSLFDAKKYQEAYNAYNTSFMSGCSQPVREKI
jgi:hypothetical protein